MHYGHLELLRRASLLGDRLIVALSTDAFNKKKNKVCTLSYLKRKEMLEAIKYVDVVISEDTWEQKQKDIIENKVDIFVMGDDWEGKFDELNNLCEVVYLTRTKGISTTKLKAIMAG